jgi:Phage tail assembly chaperone proteins, E, or 41 or 14
MTQKYKLKHPIRFTHFDVIEEVEIRRPKVSDLRAMGEKGIGGPELLQKLTGLQAPVMDEMDAEDYFALSEIALGFFPTHLRTGASF